MEISPEYAVQMRGIMETFGSFRTLDQMRLGIKKGSIHAILGKSGASRSTLMNTLYSLYQADAGEIFLNGEKVAIRDLNDAIARGIGVVHQHSMLADNFTVTKNIILGKEITGQFGVLDMRKARENVPKIVKEYNLEVDPNAKIEDISVGMQRRVKILRALYRGADILILDRPTTAFTPQKIGELTEIIRDLIGNGKTIIIITHKLKEIQSSSDVCTIIRCGQYIDAFPIHDMSEEELATKMVGRQVELVVGKTSAEPGEVVFEIENLTVKDECGLEAVKSLSPRARRGEIVGIAGVNGDGQGGLVEAITCLTEMESGTIRISGTEIQNTAPRNVVEHKISAVHKDCQRRGLVMPFIVAENTVLEKYHSSQFSRRGMLLLNKITAFTKRLVEDYDIHPADYKGHPARGLSGSNQQKVIITREISSDPDLLVAVQPTRGLNVGAIEYVHKMLVQERDKGRDILLVSLELNEILSVADTVCVIYGGTITDAFTQEKADENAVGLLMAGGKRSKNAG